MEWHKYLMGAKSFRNQIYQRCADDRVRRLAMAGVMRNSPKIYPRNIDDYEKSHSFHSVELYDLIFQFKENSQTFSFPQHNFSSHITNMEC